MRLPIPFGVRNRLNSWRTKRCLGEALDALAPLEVPTHDFVAEVHMMVSKLHLHRTLACLQTFFRHSGLSDRVGVVFHLDGSVRPRHRRLLESHIPGAAFTDFPSRDDRVRQVLANRPYCRDYYERRVSCMTRLVHAPVLARVDRVIQIDSDIVFWSKPKEIVEWVDDPQAPPLYQVNYGGDSDPGSEAKKVFEEIIPNLRGHAGELRIRDYFFVAGLIMFPPSRFSFDMVEDYLRWHAHSNKTKEPNLFWFWDWTVELTTFMLNFAAWPDAEALPRHYVVGTEPSDVSNHYFAGMYYRPEILTRIRQSLMDLHSAREGFASAAAPAAGPAAASPLRPEGQ